MSVRWNRSLLLVAAVAVCVALVAGRVMAKGGHGGGHHGGGHHGGGHHGGHHNHHHSHHASHHHHGHHGHHGWGGGGWGSGWGGWGSGWGANLGWGVAGYGQGRWGTPVGGWGSYANNQPISVPLGDNYATNGSAAGSAPGTAALASNSEPAKNTLAGSDDSAAKNSPAINQLASNANEDMLGESEEDPLDSRGAIYLALPTKDAEVYLNDQLVQGEGARRVLFTPEFDEENQPEKFQLRTVWQENGQSNERAANVEVSSGGGIAVNFTKPIDPQAPSIALYTADDVGDESQQLIAGESSGAGEPAGNQQEAQSQPAGQPERRQPVAH
jgi:hypothetical protein